MTGDQTADITWKPGGVPVSARFDDPYFSLENGLAETRHTFLDGNDLPARLRGGFHVAELGFGTGLNMLALASVWDGPGPVHFTSFEAYPMAADDIENALAAFPDLRHLARPYLAAWRQGARHFQVANLSVTIIEGDARQALTCWPHKADAWFLDGFSPAKNPELWGADLMENIARHTSPGGTFATYTAAGHVRRALSDAGFVVTRRPGFGRKRHMSVGRLQRPGP
ncbi:MAG TPA: FAD-dependent oxidoreductase [Aliiroseovarius sp.]|nr:FAD-dependent oxidoreductase [Aliiroseovarius sp.]